MLSTSFADHVPEIAQSMRLGHRLSDKVIETYSHVAPEVQADLLRCLQHRWNNATASRAPAHRLGPKRRRHAHHTARTHGKPTQVRTKTQVSSNTAARRAQHTGARSAPVLLQSSAYKDQQRLGLSINANTTKALRPAETPARRAFIEEWS
jgi:hypothetical protein